MENITNNYVGIGGTKVKMLDLFSGIGGISLAAHWAGVETVAFCEMEPFCQKVLNKHWPDIPIFDYVKELLQEIRPHWFIGENVVGHVTLGLDTVLADLESIGYTSQPFIIPACGVGAIHRRERVFIVANSDSEHVERSCIKTIQRKPTLQRIIHTRSIEEWTGRSEIYQPKLCRSFNGVPNQVDRLRALGNAVVPQQCFPIFKAIMQISNTQTSRCI